MRTKILITVLIFAAMVSFAMIGVTAQQPKPSAPTYPLNPDASKVWANIDQAEAELQRQFQQLESQRATLLIGAGVPQDSRQCKVDDKGIVICGKPETAKTEKK